MTTKHTLTFVLMDAPFESARTTTAFRLLHAAIDRGCDVNVFAYEGAVALAFAKQVAHANAVHGRDGVRRGSPADCWKMAQQSSATLVIPTK